MQSTIFSRSTGRVRSRRRRTALVVMSRRSVSATSNGFIELLSVGGRDRPGAAVANVPTSDGPRRWRTGVRGAGRSAATFPGMSVPEPAATPQATAPGSTVPSATEPDPRRWLSLGILITVVLVTGLDPSVLSIATPTILRDFHTTLPTLQWAITGYSLTFATFLIIGGRLGDLYGRRRMFVIGAALFGVGSFIAAVSTSAPI